MIDDFSPSEFFRHILPDDDMVGLLDWSSGLMVLNATPKEYEMMLAESASNHPNSIEGPFPPLKHYKLNEAQTHELIHCFQIILCGYPHKLACDLWSILGNAYEDDEGSGALHNILPHETETVIKQVNNTLSGLDQTVDGVSVASILESSAFLAQKRCYYPNLTKVGYRRFLESHFAQESIYRAAYDYAERWLQPINPPAFDLFQLLAFVSLCAISPAHAFTGLARKVQIPDRAKRSEWQMYVNEAVCQLDLKMYGDAVEYQRTHRSYHPVFSAALYRVATIGQQRLGELEQLFISPHAFRKEMAQAAMSPIVLRSRNGIWTLVDYNKHWRSEHLGHRKSEMTSLLVTCALSAQTVERLSLNAARAVFEPLRRKSNVLAGLLPIDL